MKIWIGLLVLVLLVSRCTTTDCPPCQPKECEPCVSEPRVCAPCVCEPCEICEVCEPEIVYKDPTPPELSEIKTDIRDGINGIGGGGMPAAAMVKDDGTTLEVEYSSWWAHSYDNVQEEELTIARIVLEAYANADKPDNVIFRAISSPNADEVYTTSMSWVQMEKLANMELSMVTWKDLTEVYEE